MAQQAHIDRALVAAEELAAPADGLEAGTARAVQALVSRSVADIIAHRSSMLGKFTAQARASALRSAELSRESPAHVRSVLAAASQEGVNLGLLEWACEEAQVPGRAKLVHAFAHGFPLVGTVLVDPLAPAEVVKAASWSGADVLRDAHVRAPRLAAKARAGRSGQPEFGDGDAREIWQSTLDEIGIGRISPLAVLGDGGSDSSGLSPVRG